MLNQAAQVDTLQTTKTQTKNDIQDTPINLSKILLQKQLFDDKFYDSIKADDNILSLRDLVQAFCSNECAVEKLLQSAITDRKQNFIDIINEQKNKKTQKSIAGSKRYIAPNK